jgi:hypothetical protein
MLRLRRCGAIAAPVVRARGIGGFRARPTVVGMTKNHDVAESAPVGARRGAGASEGAVTSDPVEAGALFLGPDLVALDNEIETLRRSVCAYSRTSLPDGAAADAIMAEFQAVLDRLVYLVRLRRVSALVPCPYDAVSADLGVTVTYLPLSSAVTDPERVSLGSVFVSERLARRGFVSYLSDLGLLLRGAVPGDVRRGVVADEEVSVRVLSVETAIPLLLPA